MPNIGIPLRYNHLPDGRCILFLGEKIRRCVQKAGGFIVPIVQVQDFDYCDTKYDEFPELSDNEKEMIEKYLDMVDGVIFPGGNKIAQFDEYSNFGYMFRNAVNELLWRKIFCFSK